jgi:hypothetical protein
MATYNLNSAGLPIPDVQHTTPSFPEDSIGTAPTEFHYAPQSVGSETKYDRMKQNPLESLELDELDLHVKTLFEREFKDKKSVTEEELIIGARLARSSMSIFLSTRCHPVRV